MVNGDSERQVGKTQAFVLARGFHQVGEHWALYGEGGKSRLFAEITADPDRPDVRPREAYHALLTSMQPGWTVRMLQIFWPDPIPREAFRSQIEKWPQHEQKGMGLLQDGLTLFLETYPLPFMRRTILEFVLLNKDSLGWWEGIAGLFRSYGLQIAFLSDDDIRTLARWVFNPDLTV